MTNDIKTEIYESYHAKVQNFIYSKVNDMYLAEDICSDVFIKIYEKYDRFDESKSSLSTWIFTIARNTLIDYYRTRHVHEEVPEDMAQDSDVEEEVLNGEMLNTLASALEKLGERERDLIILHYYSGLKLNEIAEKMDISYSYVKILHKKALVELRTNLGEDYAL